MTDPSLYVLLQKVSTGDESAWEQACELLYADLHRVALRVTGDAHLADDVVQDALLALRESAGRFKPRTDNPAMDARRFCRAIAAHLALKMRRTEARSPMSPLADANQVEQPASTDTRGSGDPERLTTLLHQALADLAEPFSQAVTLHHLGGLSCDQVAAIQGVRPATARTRIWRGIQQLRKWMAKRGAPIGLVLLLALLRDLSADIGGAPPVSPVVSLMPTSSGVILMTTTAAAIVATTAMSLTGLAGIGAAEETEPAGGPAAPEAAVVPPTQATEQVAGTDARGRVFVLDTDDDGELQVVQPVGSATAGTVQPWPEAVAPGTTEILERDGERVVRYQGPDGVQHERVLAPERPALGANLAAIQQAMVDGYLTLPALSAFCRAHGNPVPDSFAKASFVPWDGKLPDDIDAATATGLLQLREAGTKVMCAMSVQGDRILHWMTQAEGPTGVPALNMVAIQVQADGAVSWLRVMPGNG